MSNRAHHRRESKPTRSPGGSSNGSESESPVRGFAQLQRKDEKMHDDYQIQGAEVEIISLISYYCI